MAFLFSLKYSLTPWPSGWFYALRAESTVETDVLGLRWPIPLSVSSSRFLAGRKICFCCWWSAPGDIRGDLLSHSFFENCARRVGFL